jgi:predicted PurR-regulated permease PerM
MAESRRTIDIAPAAIIKVIAAIVIVWLWLHLWPLLMLLLVAVVLAIGLEPLVEWLERRRVPRAVAAAVWIVVLAGLVGVFFWTAGSSLVGQAKELSSRITAFEHAALGKLPPWLASEIRTNGGGAAAPAATAVAGYVFNAGRLVITGIVVAVLALILTLYFLIEGEQTYAWLAAYAPPEHRSRVNVTAREARKAIRAYIIGNVATSVFATIFVYVLLTLLKVPAALLLAILAGLFDFIPVLGFICSSVPAVLLALSVSPAVALTVASLYVAYHLIENYYIGPKVYGDRLKLSGLAVILAFAVGAEIGGVVGALLALPIAALYPVIENVWLKDYLGRDAVETHRRIERRSRSSSL